VDKANATISLKPMARFTGASCTGEDGITYTTLKGTWVGSETDATPGSTDYSLAGSLKVSGVVWEINTATGRGYLTGTISLVTSTSATLIYVGKLTLVTQGLPAAGATVPGRGTIVASFKPADDGIPPPGDDILFANVEFGISGTLSASGVFGDSAPTFSTPNFSVVTNVKADGVC
jgi:hypothetical protein